MNKLQEFIKKINCSKNKETEFWKADSKSDLFKSYIEKNFFDLVLIDGDHSYEELKMIMARQENFCIEPGTNTL